MIRNHSFLWNSQARASFKELNMVAFLEVACWTGERLQKWLLPHAATWAIEDPAIIAFLANYMALYRISLPQVKTSFKELRKLHDFTGTVRLD